jgi:hypothetical protein
MGGPTKRNPVWEMLSFFLGADHHFSDCFQSQKRATGFVGL